MPLSQLLDRVADGLRARQRRKLGLPRQAVQAVRPASLLGSDYGGYVVCPWGLGPDSVVYSFGVGEDVSLDLALIERFGLTVHAFDPTPRSVAWAETQGLPPSFVLHPWGLAAHDGTARFTPPENPEHISHTVLDRSRYAGEVIEVEVRRLRSIMDELGHVHLDVLKMDIEGAEYEAIEEIVASGVSFDQLLVEFHHHLEGVPLSRTEASIDRLNRAGYRLYAIRDSGHEMSFLRV